MLPFLKIFFYLGQISPLFRYWNCRYMILDELDQHTTRKVALFFRDQERYYKNFFLITTPPIFPSVGFFLTNLFKHALFLTLTIWLDPDISMSTRENFKHIYIYQKIEIKCCHLSSEIKESFTQVSEITGLFFHLKVIQAYN